MGFTLEKVVPWGRSYDEYVAMFGLTGADLDLRILGCGDGPAAFNSELTKRGGKIVSIDPVYVFNAEQIRGRITETYGTVMTQMRKNHGDYIWEVIPSVEQLGHLRMSAMETFLSGTGFVTPSLTFLRSLSKAVIFNHRKTFRTGQHAPSGPKLRTGRRYRPGKNRRRLRTGRRSDYQRAALLRAGGDSAGV